VRSFALKESRVAGELFGQAAVRGGVSGVDENEAVGKVFDGGDQGRIGRG
jgi:hypothetical protein